MARPVLLLERIEISNSEPSVMVRQGVACVGGLYIDSNGENGSPIKPRHSTISRSRMRSPAGWASPVENRAKHPETWCSSAPGADDSCKTAQHYRKGQTGSKGNWLPTAKRRRRAILERAARTKLAAIGAYPRPPDFSDQAQFSTTAISAQVRRSGGPRRLLPEWPRPRRCGRPRRGAAVAPLAWNAQPLEFHPSGRGSPCLAR